MLKDPKHTSTLFLRKASRLLTQEIIISSKRPTLVKISFHTIIIATQKPVPPTASAPAPPTAKGFQPTPRNEATEVLRPTEAMAVPKAYLDMSLPITFMHVV